MKKIVSVFMSAIMLITLTAGLTFNVNAQTSGDYEYSSLLGDGVFEITKYNGKEENITIPAELDGNKITYIYCNAFKDCKTLKSVTVPEGILMIKANAFENCTSLEKISLPNSLKKIGNEAFKGCSSLKSIYLPDNLAEIQSFAFENTGLTAFEVSKNNKTFKSSNGILYNKKMTKLFLFPNKKSVKTYTTPKTVTAIGEGAFSGCTKITAVKLTSNVKNINNLAFYGCSSLTKITVDSKNKYFSSKDGVLFNKAKTKLLTYPASIKNKSYTIPNTVNGIEVAAFTNCKYLTTLRLPKKVKYIGYGVGTLADSKPFLNCKKLKNVYYSGSKSDWNKIYYYETKLNEDNNKTYKIKETYYQLKKANGSKNDILKTFMNNAQIHYNAK